MRRGRTAGQEGPAEDDARGGWFWSGAYCLRHMGRDAAASCDV